MAAKKSTKVITRRKKFQKVDIPLTRSKIELIGNSLEEIEGRTIKLDLTRQLKGKSVEATVKIKIEDDKAVAYPVKIRLLPYFIRRMIRKRISYVEDSFEIPTQESMIQIKPFLITRKRVSRAVRKTLRNKTKNWLEDYIGQKKDAELFSEVLSNRLQKPLSLNLKKTYPLSLCEIRILEIKRPLNPEEVPKIIKKEEKSEKTKEKEIEKGIDQLQEIQEEIEKGKVKEAEEEIKKTQKKATKTAEKEEKTEKKEIKTKETKTKTTKTKKSEEKEEETKEKKEK